MSDDRCIHATATDSWRGQASMEAVKDGVVAGKLGDPGLLRIHRWRSETEGSDVQAAALIRDLDIAQWLFGERPQSVYALARDDYLQVHLGFSNGGMALLDFARLPRGEGYESLSFIGSTGAAYADDHHNMNLCFAGGKPVALRTGQGSLENLGQLEEFVAATGGAERGAPTFPSTSSITTLVEAVRSSVDSGRAAHIAGDAYGLA